jgi:hypothetical protein
VKQVTDSPQWDLMALSRESSPSMARLLQLPSKVLYRDFAAEEQSKGLWSLHPCKETESKRRKKNGQISSTNIFTLAQNH